MSHCFCLYLSFKNIPTIHNLGAARLLQQKSKTNSYQLLIGLLPHPTIIATLLKRLRECTDDNQYNTRDKNIRRVQGWGQYNQRIGIDQFNSNSIPELEHQLELKDLEQNEFNWNKN